MSEPDIYLKIYADFHAYADADLIDIKALAEKHQTTPQAVGAYLKNLKGGPQV